MLSAAARAVSPAVGAALLVTLALALTAPAVGVAGVAGRVAGGGPVAGIARLGPAPEHPGVVGRVAGGAPVAGIARLGPAPAHQRLSVILPLQANLAGLERYATAVSTPGSPDYGRYESIQALSERFGGSPPVRARTLAYLRAVGATRVRIDATGLFAQAAMPVWVVQRSFGVSLSSYRGAHAAGFVASSQAARIPRALAGAVTGVVGLDTQPLFTPPSLLRRESAAISGYPRRTGTAAGCSGATSGPGFTPNQYQTAYGYSALHAAGAQGQGERVALVEIDGFRYSDLRNFSKCFGLATPAIDSFGVGVSKPLAPGGEATLDLEVLDAAAPRLGSIDVYETHPAAADVLQALTAPLQNRGRRPDVISASLGACEQQVVASLGAAGVRSIEGSLAEAAASGISVLAAAGDAGSSSCLTRSGQPIPQLAVSFPASSPLVTAVGGTNLVLGVGNAIAGQTVWNDAPAIAAAGGGGVSGLFHRPSYQAGFVIPNRRVVPDVSMLADPLPGYEIYCSVKNACTDTKHPDPWSTVGGTSAASPLLAGGLALIDQRLRAHGRRNLGLANPLLYKLAARPGQAGALSDVLTGDNDLGASLRERPLGCCSAHPGFDYASGLGGVNVAALSAAADSLVAKLASVGGSPSRRPLTVSQLAKPGS